MKGPFATYGEALDNALPGECVMARDSRCYHHEGWCVMSDAEATLAVVRPSNGWVHWEDVKEKA